MKQRKGDLRLDVKADVYGDRRQPPAGKPIRLRLALKDADVYAVRFV
jgi:hypothetical protein